MSKHEMLLSVLATPAISLILFTMLMMLSVRFRYVIGESFKAFLIAGVSCVGIMALTAIYIVSPIDLIPDFIPVLGQVDDAVAVILALLSVPAAIIGWIGRTIYCCSEALNLKKKGWMSSEGRGLLSIFGKSDLVLIVSIDKQDYCFGYNWILESMAKSIEIIPIPFFCPRILY